MGLLDGKNIVITGVLTDASLAFGVAKIAQEQGANIVLTGAGRALRLTQPASSAQTRTVPTSKYSSSTSPCPSTVSLFVNRWQQNGVASTVCSTLSVSLQRPASAMTS